MATILRQFPADRWFTVEADPDEKKLEVRLDFPTAGQQKRITQALLRGDAISETVRFVVKGWRNISFEDGVEQVPIALVETPEGRELSEDSLAILGRLGLELSIFRLYQETIAFTDGQKKSSSSSRTRSGRAPSDRQSSGAVQSSATRGRGSS